MLRSQLRILLRILPPRPTRTRIAQAERRFLAVWRRGWWQRTSHCTRWLRVRNFRLARRYMELLIRTGISLVTCFGTLEVTLETL